MVIMFYLIFSFTVMFIFISYYVVVSSSAHWPSPWSLRLPPDAVLLYIMAHTEAAADSSSRSPWSVLNDNGPDTLPC